MIYKMSEIKTISEKIKDCEEKICKLALNLRCSDCLDEVPANIANLNDEIVRMEGLVRERLATT